MLTFLPLLEPAWWVLRAYLLLFTLTLTSGGSARSALLLDVGLWRLGGPLLLAGAVVGSVTLGRRTVSRRARGRMLVAEVGLVLWTLYVLGGASYGVRYVYSEGPSAANESYPLLCTAGPVTNVFPFSSTGEPLKGVLLYDQDGRPLRVGAQE